MANVIEIVIKQTGQGTAIADTSKALGSFKGAGDTAITALLGVGKALVGVGAIATTAIVGFAASGVKAAMDVDHQLAQIAATLGTTKDAAMPLKQLMTELALDPQLTVNATQAGEAIEVLAANGMDLEDILAGGARGAVQLANATGSDFATAATIATDAIQQFGFKASDLETVADGIAGVLIQSKFDANDYALALSNAGGIAGGLGVDFGDFNTVLAATSSFFSSGSDAGTSFKTLLTRLAKPTDDVKAAMDEFGISIFDSAGQMLPFADISGKLNDVFKDLNESEKAELATRLGGTDAMRTILGLAGLTEEQFNALSAEVNQSGLASQAAATRVDSLTGAWEIFKGIIEAVQIQVGDKFLPIIRRVTEAVSVWASENSGQIVAFFGVIATGIDSAITKGTELFNAFQTGGTGGLMAAMGLTPEQIEMIMSGFTLIMDNLEVFKGALIGIGAVVGVGIFVSLAAGIIALLTPINLLIAGAALLGAAWAGNWGNIQGITQQAFATITELFNQFMVIWTTNWPIIQAVALTAWEVLQGIFAGFQTALGPILTQLNTQFTEVFGQISAILASFGISWSDVWNALLQATGIVATGIGAAILGIIGVVAGLATGIAEGISAAITMFQNLATNVAGIVTGLTTSIVGWIEVIKALFAGDLPGAFEAFKIVLQGFVTFWSNMWGGMITVVVGFTDIMVSTVSGFVNGVIGFFQGMYDQLVGHSIIPDLINSIVSWFKKLPQMIVTTLSGLASKVTAPFEDVWEGIKEAIKIDEWGALGTSAIDGLLEGMKERAADVLEFLKNLAMDSLQGLGQFWGAKSPATKFMPLGASTMQGVVIGAQSEAGKVNKSFTDLGKGAINSLMTGMSVTDPGFIHDFIDDLNMGGIGKAAGAGGGQWKNFRNILKNEITAGMSGLEAGSINFMDKITEVANRFHFPPNLAREFTRVGGLVEHLTGTFSVMFQKLRIENLAASTSLASQFAGISSSFASMASEGGEAVRKIKEAMASLVEKNKGLTGTYKTQQEELANLRAELLELTSASELDTEAITKKEAAIAKLTAKMTENQIAIQDNQKAIAEHRKELEKKFTGDNALEAQAAAIELFQEFLAGTEETLNIEKLLGAEAGDFAGQIATFTYSRIAAQQELNGLLAEQAKREEEIAKQQAAQKQLDFLSQQISLMKMLSDRGLNPKDILSGITLGLDASVDDLLAATNRVVEAMVNQIDADLGIASPSKVMFDKFKNQVGGGMVRGLLAVKPMLSGIMDPLLSPMTSGDYSKTTNNNFSMTVNTRAEQSSVIGDFRTMQLMAG